LLEIQHSPSMSAQTVESLAAQVTDMATEISLLQTRLTEALKKMEPKAAPAKKTPNDPNAPKKPLSSYMLFCDRTRKASPGMVYTATQLGELWKALSAEQKGEYKVVA